ARDTPGSLRAAAVHKANLEMRIRLGLFFWITIVCLPASATDLKGIPRIVDGDTLVLGTTKVRLEGIDAPETDQICLGTSSTRWSCGIEAREQLTAHVAGREINCTTNGFDLYGRALGTCSVAGENLNAWMAQQGWALAYVKYSSRYTGLEED